MRTIDRRTLWGALLLLSVFTAVFIVPATPSDYHRLIYRLVLSITLATGALSLATRSRLTAMCTLALIALQWLPSPHDDLILDHVARVPTMFFFAFIVLRLITQIADTRVVTRRVILAAINGYLLLGIMFGLLVATLMAYEPESFALPLAPAESLPSPYRLGDYLYYAFMTLTTVGYGDVLPRAPYAKSVAILTAVTGQLYLAVIIAALVAKYVSSSARDGA